MKSVLVRLPRHGDEAQAYVGIAGLRRDPDLLLVRQLEDRERRESDGPVHSVGDPRARAQRLHRGRREAEELEVRRDLLEQHGS